MVLPASQNHTGGFLDPLIEDFHKLGFEQFGRDRILQNQVTIVIAHDGKLAFYSDQRMLGKTQDQGYGITALWRAGARHVFYFGGAFIRRPHGSSDYSALGFRDGMGLHATWEYHKWRTVQPYVQLHWQSGYLHPQPYQHFDQPSLQHDLGVHWHWIPRTTLTFRYLNNISHQGNTADMDLGASLTAHFWFSQARLRERFPPCDPNAWFSAPPRNVRMPPGSACCVDQDQAAAFPVRHLKGAGPAVQRKADAARGCASGRPSEPPGSGGGWAGPRHTALGPPGSAGSGSPGFP